MKDSQPDKEKTIFFEAIELPEAQQRAFVENACGDDSALLRDVLKLLEEYRAGSSLLKTIPASFDLSQPFSEVPGSCIGRYKLLQKIGEGGMGVVYMAEQTEPVNRKVALKIIKLGMDTKQVIARFEAERQALALMDHPHIAKVLDAGATETGRPYFVMELVRGIPITEYCVRQKLTTQERLELFIKVCQAIQHAHQKGIIHRDVKPSNILVTLNDGEPHPMVIDFGIAKATHQKLTEKTLFTQFAQMIGTPAYMSPEQAEMSKLDVDTRTDIYSLGVLLYELITGSTPFSEKQLRSAGYAEMHRIIVEEEPDKPSTRQSKSMTASLDRATRRQKEDALSHNERIDSDLDWITMKCLEKDRRRRYDTVNGLAMDLRRHLNQDPIEARPPSTLYRWRKTYCKHKAVCQAAAVAFLALIGGITFSSWKAIEAETAREGEEQQRIQATEARQAAEALQETAMQNEAKALAYAEEMRLHTYVGDMKTAQTALDEGNLHLTRALLAKHVPGPGDKDLRGLEWRYLWQSARSEAVDHFQPHDGIAASVAYSPDGRFLATVGFDRTTRIWNARTRDLVREFPSDPVDLSFAESNYAPFSADGQFFASLENGRVKLWHTGDWSLKSDLGEAGYPLMFAAKVPLLTAKIKDAIRIWNVQKETHQDISTGKDPGLRPVTWAMAPDGSMLTESSSYKPVTLWKLPDAEKIATFEPGRAHNLTFSPDGKRLASSEQDKHLRIWNVDDLKEVAAIIPHNDNCYGLSFSPDGTLLATSGNDQRVCLWKVPGLEPVRSFQGSLSEVWKVVFSPDGRTIATAGKEEHVRFWDVPKEPSAPEELLHPEGSEFYRVMAGMQKVESKHPDGRWTFWRIQDGQMTPLLKLDRTRFQSMAFSANDHRALFFHKPDGAWHLIDCSSGKLAHAFTIPDMPVGDRGVPHFVHNVSISPDGKLMAWLSLSEGCRIYEVPSGKQVIHLNGPSSFSFATRAAFSPDGSMIAYPSQNYAFRIWSLEENREIAVLKGHHWNAYACQFSPDGSLLATSSYDGQARIWNVDTGDLHVPPLIGHIRGVDRLVFSHDGRTLLTGGDDWTIRMWNVATGREMVQIANRSGVLLGDHGNTLVMTDTSDPEILQNHPAPKLLLLPTIEEIDASTGFD